MEHYTFQLQSAQVTPHMPPGDLYTIWLTQSMRNSYTHTPRTLYHTTPCVSHTPFICSKLIVQFTMDAQIFLNGTHQSWVHDYNENSSPSTTTVYTYHIYAHKWLCVSSDCQPLLWMVLTQNVIQSHHYCPFMLQWQDWGSAHALPPLTASLLALPSHTHSSPCSTSPLQAHRTALLSLPAQSTPHNCRHSIQKQLTLTERVFISCTLALQDFISLLPTPPQP